MALALYRKYRPRTFAEIIGQEHVTEPLSQALRTGRLNHAYLFSGPRGCGKTSSARILARSLNCERGPTPDPCGECQSCRDLAPDGSGSIDVIEIDAASHGGVDDARDLRERAFFAPVSSRFKVYVIDEAHMVSSAGFNALLKLVEEPPEYVKFVFATTEPEKVLGTIKSRTHHYPFRLIPPGVLRPYLEQLTAAESVKVEPAVFPLVVRAGGGSARDSLSVLDQLIAGAGEEGVTYSRAVALLGVTDVALIDEMCEALAADDGRGAYGVIDRVVEAGHDPRRFASDLLERLRDLIVLRQVPDAVEKGLLDAPHDQLERMGAQAAQLGQATLSRFADIVHNGLTEMRGTTAPRLLLELVTARMLLPAADDSSSALLQRLERLERRLQAGGVPAPVSGAPVTAPPPVAAESGNRGLDYIRDARAGSAVAPPAAPASAPAPPSPPVAWAEEPAPPPEAVEPTPVPAPPVTAPPVAAPPAAAPPVSAPPVTAPPVAAPPVTAPPVAAPTVAAPPVAATPPAPVNGGGGLDAEAIRRVWPDLLALVNDKSKKAGAIVREATVQDVEGTTLVLGFKYSTHAEMLNASPDVLLKALQELLGGRWQVRCEVGGQPGGGGGGNRPAPPKPTPQPSGPSASPTSPAGPAAGQSFAAPQQARPQASHERSGAPAASSSAAAATAAVVKDEEWPVAAVPGGLAAAGAASTAAEEWPTPAAPGGEWPAPATPGGSAGLAVGAQSPASSPAAGGVTSPGGASLSPGPSHSAPSSPGVPASAGTGRADSSMSPPGPPFAPGAAGSDVPSSPGAAQSGGPSSLRAGQSGVSSSPEAARSGVPSPTGAAQSGAPSSPGAAQSGVPSPTASTGGGRTTAPPSGVAAARAAAAASSSSAYAGNSGPTASVSGGSTATMGGGAPSAPVRPRQGGSSAIEKAREAASRAAAGGGRRSAGGNAGPASAPARGVNDSAWEGAGADEPPFDPEYDSPVADARFPGLDPGDELLDDESEVRETSEEAALRLLMETLGAEKISEVGA